MTVTTRMDLFQLLRRRLTEAQVDQPVLDAELLLCRGLGLAREGFWRDPERGVSEQESARVLRLLARREAREPVAYILGRREFWSLEFEVTPDVLIPRPETETLMEELLARIPPARRGDPWAVLDVGTGCGALAVAAARELPAARVAGLDLSRPALQVARRNARRHGVGERCCWVLGDARQDWRTLDLPLPRFDFILANPPYLRSEALGQLPPEIARHEPARALDGGPDGLAFYACLGPAAAGRLNPGGWLLMEIGHDQGEAVRSLLAPDKPFEPVTVHADAAGYDRVVAARRTGGEVHG